MDRRDLEPGAGCTKISAGCKHCYAETFAERRRGIPGHPYEQGFDLRLAPHKLLDPLTWRRPRKIFVNSMSDLFHEDVTPATSERCSTSCASVTGTSIKPATSCRVQFWTMNHSWSNIAI